jgi:hypothetical protein
MIGFSLLAVSFPLLPPAYLDLLELLNSVQIGAKRFHLVFDGIHGDRFGYSGSAKRGGTTELGRRRREEHTE